MGPTVDATLLWGYSQDSCFRHCNFGCVAVIGSGSQSETAGSSTDRFPRIDLDRVRQILRALVLPISLNGGRLSLDDFCTDLLGKYFYLVCSIVYGFSSR